MISECKDPHQDEVFFTNPSIPEHVEEEVVPRKSALLTLRDAMHTVRNSVQKNMVPPVIYQSLKSCVERTLVQEQVQVQQAPPPRTISKVIGALISPFGGPLISKTACKLIDKNISIYETHRRRREEKKKKVPQQIHESMELLSDYEIEQSDNQEIQL